MAAPRRISTALLSPLLLPALCLLLSLTGVAGQSCGYSQVDLDFCVCGAGSECGLPDPTVKLSVACNVARICKRLTSPPASEPPPAGASSDNCGYSTAGQTYCACVDGYKCTLTNTEQVFAGACSSLPDDSCTAIDAPGSDAPAPSADGSEASPPPFDALPPSSTDSPITTEGNGFPTLEASSPPPVVADGVCGYSIPDEGYCKCPDKYKCGLSSATERISGLCSSVKCTKSRCFTGSMTVAVEGKKGRTPMSELLVGDRVMVQQRDGSLSYERVFAFSHRAAAEEMVTVTLTTDKGFTVEASLGHYLLTGAARARTAMRDVKVGDVVWVESADAASLEADVVVARDVKTGVGAYAPHTASGSIVVGGVVASCYTEHIAPHLAEVLLMPVRMLSGVLGDWAAHAANDAVLKLVAKA